MAAFHALNACLMLLPWTAVECDCCQGRRVCLHHAHNLCGCHMTQRRLVYRHSLRQLESVRAAVQACVPAAAASEIGAAEEASAARIAAAAAAGAASAAVPAAGSAEPDAAPQPAGKQKQQSKEQAAKAPAAAAKADDQAAAAVPKGSKSAGAAVRGAPAQQGVGVPAAGTAGGEQAPADGSAAQQAQTETKPARMHGDGASDLGGAVCDCRTVTSQQLLTLTSREPVVLLACVLGPAAEIETPLTCVLAGAWPVAARVQASCAPTPLWISVPGTERSCLTGERPCSARVSSGGGMLRQPWSRYGRG
jgi:hypothetical protein